MTLWKKVFFSLAFILLIIVYFYHFADIPHFRYDEGNLIDVPYQLAYHAHFGSAALENGGDQTHYFHIHPPFYYVCLAAVFKLFGYGIEQARLFSMFLAFLTIGCFYFLLREMKVKDKSIYLIGVLSTPLFFVLAKTIRPEMMMALLFILSFLFLVRWEHRNKKLDLILGAVVTSLMMMTHMFGIPVLLLWVYSLLSNKKWKYLLFYMGALVIPTIPYVLWIIKSWDAFTLQVIVDRGVAKIDILQKGLEVIQTTIFSKKVGLIAYALIFFSAIFVLNYNKIRTPLKQFVIWGVALFWLQFLLLPKFNELYVVLLIPLLFLIIALLVNNLLKWRKLLLFICAGMIVVNMLGIAMIMHKYQKYSFHDYEVLLRNNVKFKAETKIMGNFSIIPVFHEAQFTGFQTYNNERSLFKAINEADFVVIDDFTRNNMSVTMNKYVISIKKKISEFYSPYYGSEGQHENNLIEIYQKK